MPRLVAIGGGKPREFLLADGEIWIGTAPQNDLVLKDATVSRRHATLVRQGDVYELTDLGTNNGTFVNGQRIIGSVVVGLGDELRFGTTRYSLRDGTSRPRLRLKPSASAAQSQPSAASPATPGTTPVAGSAVAAHAAGVTGPAPAGVGGPPPVMDTPVEGEPATATGEAQSADQEPAARRETRTTVATPDSESAPDRPIGVRDATLVIVAAAILGGGLALLAFVFNRGSSRQIAGVTATPVRPVASAQVAVSPPGAAATASPGSILLPTPAASAKPSPTARRKRIAARPAPFTPESAGETAAWLLPLNRFRGVAHLLFVTADPALSLGDREHARYLVYTYRKEIRRGRNLGESIHAENPSNPWYSAQGNAAAAGADVEFAAGPPDFAPGSRAWAFDSWMTVPFHRLRILSPRLRRVGYGEFCDRGVCAAVLSARSESNAPAALAYPIEFPPGGTLVKFHSARGEWPDPLSACPGYSAPSGLPITLELGALVNPRFSGYTLTLNGTAPAGIEACGFDSNSYHNSEPAADRRARETLRDSGAVVVIPRAPLLPGNYTVSITAAGRQYSWSFTVSP